MMYLQLGGRMENKLQTFEEYVCKKFGKSKQDYKRAKQHIQYISETMQDGTGRKK